MGCDLDVLCFLSKLAFLRVTSFITKKKRKKKDGHNQEKIVSNFVQGKLKTTKN